MAWMVGPFKQELIKDYNNINLRMFDIGVKSQKVDIVGDKVLIIAHHKRIAALKYLDEINRSVTKMTDLAIIDAFKVHLKEVIEEKYGMKVRSILKDYDPYTEISGTVIIFDKQVSSYIDMAN